MKVTLHLAIDGFPDLDFIPTKLFQQFPHLRHHFRGAKIWLICAYQKKDLYEIPGGSLSRVVHRRILMPKGEIAAGNYD
jgi:hypothetical protein